MVYMSKTKRKRVRKQNFIRLGIAIAIIAAILVIIWQASLGSVLAKVGETPIRSGMVNGVENFLEYIQSGQVSSDSTRGMTKEEKATQNDMKLVERNSLVQNVFIASEVLKQYFASEGISFPNEEQQAEIDEYFNNYYGTPEAIKEYSANGIKKEHVYYYFEYAVLMSAYNDYIAEKNPVTEEEALAFYEENQVSFVTPFAMQASHILLDDPEHTDAKRAEMEDILDRINNGEDFAELATELSDDGSAESGGDLGFFGLGEMVPEFEEACLELKPGEVSEIVETEFGYHIIKMTEVREESITPFEDVKASIEWDITSKRATEAMNALLESANITYTGLINPTTGKPPITLAELDEARGTTDTSDEAAAEDVPAEEDVEDHEGHEDE